MNAERSVLTKALITGQLEKLIIKGVSTDYFFEDDTKQLWEFSLDHLNKYKMPPSLDAVKERFPDYAFEHSTDSFEYLFERFVKQAKREAAITGLRKISKVIDDPEKVMDVDAEILDLGSKLSHMFMLANSERFSEMDKRISAYEQRESAGQVKGMPFGIREIDECTYGIRNHEFVSIVGWQGLGKSTLAQHIAFSSYLAGFTPLIVSLEMESTEMFDRFDTMALNFESRALQTLGLSDKDKEQWEEWAIRAKSLTNDIIIVDDVSNCTVEKVHSILQQYKPDLAIVDYVSLMQAPGGTNQIWEKVTELTKGLKQIARDPKMPPLISVAQTNIGSADGGAALENIAYSRSIGQDSDIVLGLHQDEAMETRNQMEIRMLKNRRGPRTTSQMYWNPGKMEFRDWSTKDMFTHEPQLQVDGQAVQSTV